MRRAASLIAIALLSGCSLPNWFGKEEKPPIPGERVTVLSRRQPITATDSAKNDQIAVPRLPQNSAWPQDMGNATAVVGNLAFSAKPAVRQDATTGDGEDFTGPIVPDPVIAGGRIYTLDGIGVITSHKADALDTVVWQSRVLTGNEDEEDEDDLAWTGGGLAFGKGTLYAVSDEGRIAALAADSGKKRWNIDLNMPVRAAPRLAGDVLLILTADNQLQALSTNDGSLLWTHQSMTETGSRLQHAVPAARGGTIVVPYSSGEYVGLAADSGAPLWSDTLRDLRPSADETSLGGSTSPVMSQNVTFAAGSGLLAALENGNGNRLWERRVRLDQVPWLSGNTLFLLTDDAQLVAVRGLDGAVNWVQSLPVLEDPTDKESDPIHWQGPIVAADLVWVMSDHGELRALSPQDGKQVRTVEIPEGGMSRPVVANGTMYLLTRDATLLAIK